VTSERCRIRIFGVREHEASFVAQEAPYFSLWTWAAVYPYTEGSRAVSQQPSPLLQLRSSSLSGDTRALF
jgi:hypothetical protein